MVVMTSQECIYQLRELATRGRKGRFRGREALSEPFRWDIEFTTQQANIPPEQVLMKYASFRMRSGKNVHGIITRLEWLSTSKDQSHYRATLSSRLTLLGYTRQCAIYQNQSVPEVVEQVLRKHGLEGPDFEFRLEHSYPSRELITQWRETGLQFIQRILSEVGIYWRTEMDNTRELDTFIFADSQLNYHVVEIRFKIESDNAVNKASVAQAKKSLTEGVKQYWDNQFSLKIADPKCGTRILPIEFKVIFVKSDEHYIFKIHDKYDREGVTGNVLDVSKDTGPWTYAHEFGHCYGLPDEYGYNPDAEKMIK